MGTRGRLLRGKRNGGGREIGGGRETGGSSNWGDWRLDWDLGLDIWG